MPPAPYLTVIEQLSVSTAHAPSGLERSSVGNAGSGTVVVTATCQAWRFVRTGTLRELGDDRSQESSPGEEEIEDE